MAFDGPDYDFPRQNIETLPAMLPSDDISAFQKQISEIWGTRQDIASIAADQDPTFINRGALQFRVKDQVEDAHKSLEEAKATATANADGSTVWKNERGQVIRLVQRDGLTHRYSYDEKGNVKQVDQWVPGHFGSLNKVLSAVKQQDGSWQMVGADGQPLGEPKKGELRVRDDGSRLWKGADGSSTFVRTDGSSETKNTDGSLINRDNFGRVDKVTYKDGKTREFDYDHQGRLSFFKDADGTKWERFGYEWHALGGAQAGKSWKGQISVDGDGKIVRKGYDGYTSTHRTDGTTVTDTPHGTRIIDGPKGRQEVPAPPERKPADQRSRPSGTAAGDGSSSGKLPDRPQTPPSAAKRPAAIQPERSGGSGAGGAGARKGADGAQAARKAEAQVGSGKPGAGKGSDAPVRQKPADGAKRQKYVGRAGSDRRKLDPAAPFKVQKLPDGSTVAHYRNGDKVTNYARPTMAGVGRTIERKDGSYTDEYIDGHKSTVKRNGTKIFEYPDGNRQGIVKQVEHKDGSSFQQWKDGTKMTHKPDNDPPKMVSRTDGTDIYYFRDQSQLVLAKDGSLTRVKPDGASETIPGTFTHAEMRMMYGIGAEHGN